MPVQLAIPAGEYEVRKRFRHLETQRKRHEMPWSKSVLDLDNHKLFGRTAWGWAKIIYFYLLLYLLIFLILALMMTIFYFCSYKGKEVPQISKGAPGISRYPKVGTIKFDPNIPKDTYVYADQIDDLLDKFDKFGSKKFAECNKDKVWGYRSKSPCIIVKINRVLGFRANTYDNVESLPKNKPAKLEEIVTKFPGGHKIWLTCESTKEMEFNFIPYPYFDTSNDLKFVDRLVAVQIKEIPANDEVRVTCKIWAKNIDINEKYSGHGHVKFYLYMIIK